jgi:hypothetical protein
MMSKMKWLGLLALLAAAVLVLPAAADEDKAKAKEAGARAVELLAEAQRLARIAEKEKMPEAYIAAGSLVRQVKAITTGAEEVKLDAKLQVRDKDDKPVKGAKVKAEKVKSLDAMAERFFDRADELAAQLNLTKEVKALIRSVKALDPEARDPKPKGRGRIGGAFWQTYQLLPNQWHVWNITYDGNALAALAVMSQSSLRFRCRMEYIVNGKTERVYLDHPSTSHSYYLWSVDPKWQNRTYVITVRIFNPNATAMTYLLSTN